MARKITRRQPPEQPPPDLIVRDFGSLFGLLAQTDAGHDWIAEHIPEDAPRMGGAIYVEHRYIEDIINGAMGDGLYVLVIQR